MDAHQGLRGANTRLRCPNSKVGLIACSQLKRNFRAYTALKDFDSGRYPASRQGQFPGLVR